MDSATVEMVTAALSSVLSFEVMGVVLVAAAYGIAVGSIPGLTATMATALIIPLTFYLSDIQAIAAIVTTVTCSIFAGDLPATLVRIPGTPASAAYASDAYALTQAGRHRLALSTSLWCSVLGGLFGTIVLMVAAPQLAQFAARFTSFEYFWMYVLGLSCAIVVSGDSKWKGAFALALGLLLSSVGLGTDFSLPRLTLGFNELISGVSFIPAMIGLFGISEVLRNVSTFHLRRSGAGHSDSKPEGTASIEPESGDAAGEMQSGVVLATVWKRKFALARSSTIGSLVGMLPGAGADLAAWISYAVSKRFSREPGKYGQGSLEGLGDATGANNAALGGAWIPALVFGIPGDSVTAIAIGVLLMKNVTPGPGIFDATENLGQATLVASIYIVFILANLLLLPLGWLAIRTSSLLIRIPPGVLLPMIVIFCIVGSYAMSSSYFDVWIMLAMGLVGFALERFGIPLGPVVLGLIMGSELEHRFLQCLAGSEGVVSFFNRPIAATIAFGCGLLWVMPLVVRPNTDRRLDD